jgi:hypothetical protein
MPGTGTSIANSSHKTTTRYARARISKEKIRWKGGEIYVCGRNYTFFPEKTCRKGGITMSNKIGIRYHKFWIVVGALALVVLCWGSTKAHAFPSYLSAFISQYPSTSGTKLNACILCHNSSSGGSRNSYGTAYENNGHSFTNIQTLDSDGDTFININEINAVPPTFPGNSSDFPQPPTGLRFSRRSGTRRRS